MGAHFIEVNWEHCTGCKTCELVCSLHHHGECNPQRSAINIVRRETRGLVYALPLVCQQCVNAACIGACPSNAISRHLRLGNLVIDSSLCNGCGDCVSACPAGCIRFDDLNTTAFACDFCNGEPQCVAFCHAGCLSLVDCTGSQRPHEAQMLANILQGPPFVSTAEEGMNHD